MKNDEEFHIEIKYKIRIESKFLLLVDIDLHMKNRFVNNITATAWYADTPYT